MRSRPLPEHLIEGSIVDWVRACIVGAFIAKVPNEGTRTASAIGKLKRQGLVPGMPDLVVIYQGSAAFFEIKTTAGKTSAAQDACHAAIKAAGAPVYVVRSLDGFRHVVSELGWSSREASA